MSLFVAPTLLSAQSSQQDCGMSNTETDLDTLALLADIAAYEAADAAELDALLASIDYDL